MLAFVKRLLRDESGNALMIGAAFMPLLLGAAGLAVDTIQLGVWKRELQRAADSGAVAGAYSLAQGGTPAEAVGRDLDQNSFPALSGDEVVQVGARAGFDQAVHVELTAERALPFMSLFVDDAPVIRANATAALVSDGVFCVLSLYNGDDAGIDVNGNANVNLGCGMATNSRAQQSITAGGSSLITASPLMSVGGLVGSANNFADETVLQPHSAEQRDPFAYLPDPPAQSGCIDAVIEEGPESELSPGCYNSLTISGSVLLNPGTYYVTGDIDFQSKADVRGDGVTFVMTGPGGAAGDLKWNAQATLNLTAPDDGPYRDVLFYRDRRASNIEIKINGGAEATLSGAFYFPTSDITFAGHAGLQVRCFQMVGQILRFRGTADLINSCDDRPELPGFNLNFVRLVG